MAGIETFQGSGEAPDYNPFSEEDEYLRYCEWEDFLKDSVSVLGVATLAPEAVLVFGDSDTFAETMAIHALGGRARRQDHEIDSNGGRHTSPESMLAMGDDYLDLDSELLTRL